MYDSSHCYICISRYIKIIVSAALYTYIIIIRECGSNLYVGVAQGVSFSLYIGIGAKFENTQKTGERRLRQSINQINQITMRVLSPMWEVALVKSILQAELLIYVAKYLMLFNVTKRTVNQSYSSISSWVFLKGAFLESLHHRSSWSLYCYSSPLPFASSSAAASSPYPPLPPASICP